MGGRAARQRAPPARPAPYQRLGEVGQAPAARAGEVQGGGHGGGEPDRMAERLGPARVLVAAARCAAPPNYQRGCHLVCVSAWVKLTTHSRPYTSDAQP